MAGGKTKALSKSCVFVIVVAGVERFAFKGVASNLVTYLTEVMKLSNSSAAKIVNSWCGVNFLLPLLGAFLADTLLGRYSTILASSFVYVVGLVALTSTAIVSERNIASKTSSSSSSSSIFPLLWSLFLISVAQGGYNPCLQAFGAEQLDNEEELPCTKDGEGSNQKSLFFKWLYFGICSGSLLGISLMAYLQDTFGWALGFAIPAIAMAISIVPFSCGSRFYTVKESKGLKQIENLFKAIKASVPKIITRRITLSSSSKQSVVAELELEEKPLCSDEDINCSEALVEIPDNAIHVISDVKAVLRLLPIWAMLLTFAVIFQQPATFFTKQGMTMERSIGKSFMIPPASLQSAINVSIILLMPLYDKMVIPIIQFITRSNKGINVMQRMGIGMFLSVIAMAIAALVETTRLEIGRRAGQLQSPLGTVPISICWLLPQYIILGISDVFTVVGMQEFFYSEVPSRLRTIGMALHLSVFGVGSFLSAILISLLEIVTSDSEGRHSWFSNDMREARLDKYYWLLALSSALSLFFFVCLCKTYKSRTAYIEVACK